MSRVIGELKAILGLDKKKFDDGLNQAEGKSKSFAKISTAAIAGFAAALAGAFAAAVKVLKTTQSQGDAVQATFAGIKQAAVTAAQNIATLDFSVSLRDAYRAGKELEKVYDDLADRQRSLNVLSSENTLEVARLQGILRNRTKTEQERIEAARQIKDIYAKEAELRSGALSNAMQGEIDSLKTTYKLNQAQAQAVLDYATNYARFTREQHDALATAQKIRAELDTFPTLAKFMSKGWGDANDYARELKQKQEALSAAMAGLPLEMQKWVALWRPINDYTDEHRDGVAQLVVDYNNILSSRQRELNMADRLGDKLEENNATIDDSKRKIQDIADVWGEMVKPGTMPMLPLKSFQSTQQTKNGETGPWTGQFATTTLFADPTKLAETATALTTSYDEINASVLRAAGSIQDVFYGALTSDEGVFEAMGQALKRLAAQFAAAAAAAAILAFAISMIPGLGTLAGVGEGAKFGDMFKMLLKGGMGIGAANGLSVPPGYPNDSFGPVMLTSGETVLTAKQSDWLKNGMLVQVTGEISGRNIAINGRRQNYSN